MYHASQRQLLQVHTHSSKHPPPSLQSLIFTPHCEGMSLVQPSVFALKHLQAWKH